MEEERKVPPDYWIVKVPETEHWSQDVQEKISAIYAVYALDRNLHVYICSLTPSYELFFLEHDFVEIEELSEEDREELHEIISTHPNDAYEYMDVSMVDKILKTNPNRGRRIDLDFDPDEDPFDQIMDAWASGSIRF